MSENSTIELAELNKVRSVEPLEDMQSTLKEFLTNPVILKIYVEDLEWSEDDYNNDKIDAEEALIKVERRIASLNRFKICTRKPRTNNKKMEIKDSVLTASYVREKIPFHLL